MLQTRRLSLRNLRPGDADTMFAYRNDIRCSRYQRYTDTTLADLEKFVRDYSGCEFLSTEEEQHYAIVSEESGQMVGDFTVFFTADDPCFTLGITIVPEFQRQGYAYELLHQVVGQLRKRYPSVDLVALIDKDNAGSIALFQKLSFVQECYAESIHSYVFVIYGSP